MCDGEDNKKDNCENYIFSRHDNKDRIDRIDNCINDIHDCDDRGEFCIYLDEILLKAKKINIPFAVLAHKAFQLNEIAEDRRFEYAVSVLRKELSFGSIDSVFEHYTKNRLRLRLELTNNVDSEK